MITWFHVQGGYTYVTPQGVAMGYEDVFTKLETAMHTRTQHGRPAIRRVKWEME
jgi:2,4'-dihydroxyacetophenone dioxygenase